jgi:RimJ/RimL family protein N-acetyltransferase
MQANQDHLTAHGDFGEQLALSVADLRAELDDASGGHHRFGIVLEGNLIGRIDLKAVDPPRYSLGYWLAEGATGQGHASASLHAVCALARGLGATDIYAGVTHGNGRSVALLERAGFSAVERFERYTRFHLSLRAA